MAEFELRSDITGVDLASGLRKARTWLIRSMLRGTMQFILLYYAHVQIVVAVYINIAVFSLPE